MSGVLSPLDKSEHYWHSAKLSGEWKDRSAGCALLCLSCASSLRCWRFHSRVLLFSGCRHHITWRNNPQFTLRVFEPTIVIISLSQRPPSAPQLLPSSSSSLTSPASAAASSPPSASPQSARSEQSQQSQQPLQQRDLAFIGLYIARKTTASNSRKMTVVPFLIMRANARCLLQLSNADVVAKTLFHNQAEMHLDLRLEPSDYGYRIIPSTFEPNELAQFDLFVW